MKGTFDTTETGAATAREHETGGEPPAATQPHPLRIYGTVLGVGVLCAIAIVSVYELTRHAIEQNRLSDAGQAVFEVLPQATSTGTFRYDTSSGSFQPVSDDSYGERTVYAGFNQQGDLLGVAIQTQGMGYQDVIRLLYGYSLEDQAVIGIRVLESRETPGLGDRIEQDAAFLKNFERLDVRLDNEGQQLLHPLEFVKQGEKTEAWQIDGISGATVSSQAVADMLKESVDRWVPIVQRRQGDFRATQLRAQ